MNIEDISIQEAIDYIHESKSSTEGAHSVRLCI